MSRAVVAELAAVRSGEQGAASAVSSAVARLASLPGVSTASGVAATAEHAQVTGKVLPVLAPLAGLLPWQGLRRGSTVAVRGSTSLLLGLVAEATTVGSWAAVVGIPRLGLAAARELGVELDRVALVPHPGADFATVTAALLDGVDLVATCPPGRLGETQTARRLSARARNRGAVLLSLGAWPGADVELHCTPAGWAGTDGGYGHLRERRVTVTAVGRGSAARPVSAELSLPGQGGSVAEAELLPGRGSPTSTVRPVAPVGSVSEVRAG